MRAVGYCSCCCWRWRRAKAEECDTGFDAGKEEGGWLDGALSGMASDERYGGCYTLTCQMSGCTFKVVLWFCEKHGDGMARKAGVAFCSMSLSY